MDKLYQILTLEEAVESFMSIVDTPIFKRKCRSIVGFLTGLNDINNMQNVVIIVMEVLSKYFDKEIDISNDLKCCAYVILNNYDTCAYSKILNILEKELDQ